jgi:hypothetical protein
VLKRVALLNKFLKNPHKTPVCDVQLKFHTPIEIFVDFKIFIHCAIESVLRSIPRETLHNFSLLQNHANLCAASFDTFQESHNFSSVYGNLFFTRIARDILTNDRRHFSLHKLNMKYIYMKEEGRLYSKRETKTYFTAPDGFVHRERSFFKVSHSHLARLFASFHSFVFHELSIRAQVRFKSRHRIFDVV